MLTNSIVVIIPVYTYLKTSSCASELYAISICQLCSSKAEKKIKSAPPYNLVKVYALDPIPTHPTQGLFFLINVCLSKSSLTPYVMR